MIPIPSQIFSKSKKYHELLIQRWVTKNINIMFDSNKHDFRFDQFLLVDKRTY